MMKKSEAIQAMIYLGVVVQKVRSNLQESWAGHSEMDETDELVMTWMHPVIFGPQNILIGLNIINHIAATKNVIRPMDVHNILFFANQEPMLYTTWKVYNPNTPWPEVKQSQLKGWDDELEPTAGPVQPAHNEPAH